jgi:hypothetical protein
VGIDQDKVPLVGPCRAPAGPNGAGQHQVVDESEHQRRFATAGFGNRQEVPPQQTGR